MIVLDASAVIAYLEPADPWHPNVVKAMSELAAEPWTIHPITLAEVLVGPASVSTDRLTRVQNALRDIGIEQAVWAPGDALALATLRASSGLRLPDCCVVLLAQRESARLLTFDARLAAVADQLGVGLAMA